MVILRFVRNRVNTRGTLMRAWRR